MKRPSLCLNLVILPVFEPKYLLLKLMVKQKIRLPSRGNERLYNHEKKAFHDADAGLPDQESFGGAKTDHSAGKAELFVGKII